MYTKNMMQIAKKITLCLMLFLFLSGCQNFSKQQKESYYWNSSLKSPTSGSSIIKSPHKDDEFIANRKLLGHGNFDFIAPEQDGKFLPQHISADDS